MASPPPGSAPPPATLGRYKVLDMIGAGSTASVFLAHMDGPGGFQKWAAIKRLHPYLAEDDQLANMFLDEAQIAAGIKHGNVVKVFELGKDDNTYWIAMEYLHGETLRDVMRYAEVHEALVSPELAARIGSDAAEGLHAAHELRGKNNQLLGLVHRDVSPQSLFVTYDGHTKLFDFGVAKMIGRLSSTHPGTIKGRIAYMSPEQVRGAELDRTTDIFALGVVLWELTTGRHLFGVDSDFETLERVHACQVPPPSTIVPDYPVELERVLMKALAKHKQDRFQTARELSRALQTFLMRRGSLVGPEDVSQFMRRAFSDRIQKRQAQAPEEGPRLQTESPTNPGDAAPRKPIVLAPGEGRAYPMGRINAVFKADGPETESRYSISEWWLEPRTRGPGAHAHPEDDIFYVIEGTMSVLVGEEWTHASKGSFVLVPGGITHDFENRGDTRAGVLNLSIPGPFEPHMPGIAQWFRENPPKDTGA